MFAPELAKDKLRLMFKEWKKPETLLRYWCVRGNEDSDNLRKTLLIKSEFS